ncbi:HAMP domain-containing protein [Betaproteobacteria bacterium SCN1]|jgi:methyl-accepting chemotaxis protein-1 (serine sensor receptor)|nr:HAMP domain-containing protein [Betaproteobacteria bacterium SCN1]
MLKDLSIKTKLVFVIGLLSMLLVAIGGLGIYGLASNKQAIGDLQNRIERIVQLDHIIDLVTGNQVKVAASVAGQLIAFPEDIQATEQRVAEVKRNLETIHQKLEAFVAATTDPEEAKLAKALNERRLAYRKDGVMMALSAIDSQDYQRAAEVFQGPMSKAYQPMRNALQELMTHQQKQAQAAQAMVNASYATIRNITVAAVVIGMALAISIGLLMIRSITGRLNEAVRIADSVASGDLTQQIDSGSNDEAGQLMRAMKDMNSNLSQIVDRVRNGTEAITVASRQIATGNADLSSRTESQASSLEETASSMEELTSTVKQNAENARQANQLVASTAEIAAKGGTVVNEVVETMASIKDSSRKIADIIGVIDGIAFQTNILALNAAVEAARAGEQGRGFAVVASEVRSLAQRSAGAAKEIKTLIEDSVGKVDAGGRLVDEAGHTMDEIVTSVKRVTDIMSEIAAASHEQSAGIEQVNQAVGQMDEMTQQNAALVEEAAAAAESLREQAVKLAEAVSVFRVEGGHAVSATPLASRPAVAHTHVKRPAKPAVEMRIRKKTRAAGAGGEWAEF